MLNPDIFAALDILWGPHTIDRFSTFKTRQVPHFCSCWLNPCAKGIDAFTLSWAGQNNWMFPHHTWYHKYLNMWTTARNTGHLSSHCGHLLPGGRSSPTTEGTQSHLSSTGWTSPSWWICLSQKNQVPAFLVEGQTTTYWHSRSLLPMLASQRFAESHSRDFRLRWLPCNHYST